MLSFFKSDKVKEKLKSEQQIFFSFTNYLTYDYFQTNYKMNKSIATLCFVLLAGSAMAAQSKEMSEQGEGRLYFTGPGYTINLIPQAILLGILAFLAVYFLGIGEPGKYSSKLIISKLST